MIQILLLLPSTLIICASIFVPLAYTSVRLTMTNLEILHCSSHQLSILTQCGQATVLACYFRVLNLRKQLIRGRYAHLINFGTLLNIRILNHWAYQECANLCMSLHC